MSINVTVTGNPIKIQKGKMVTASPNSSQKDFERRRLIRLSQVREQSKNIAEDVRNRVRRQKLKQAEIIEKNGQIRLKQWQARKLLELQNQYHEALRDIGAGHKEACFLGDEGNTTQEKIANYDKIAKERAAIASRKLQEEKEKMKQSSSNLVEKKKFVKKMDDKKHRITSLRKASELLRKKKDENLLIENDVSGIVTDSDSEYEDIEEIQNYNTTNVEVNLVKSCESVPKSTKSDKPSEVTEEILQINEVNNLEENINAHLAASELDKQLLNDLREHKDTRISDRIKRRSQVRLEQLDCCNTYNPSCPAYGRRQSLDEINASSSTRRTETVRSESHHTIPNVQQNIYTCACNPPPLPVPISSPCYCSQPTPRKQKTSISDINQLRCGDFTDELDYREERNLVQKSKSSINPIPPCSPKRPTRQKEIPTKPKVTLKSFKNPEKLRKQLQNNTQSSKIPEAHVEKINDLNLITSPIPLTEKDFQEKIKQRDREALLRGQKALEREKLQKEYNELLKKLPVLQKLERLYEMNQDKPEYHMTEERLREQERKKQSILDNTYERLFPDRQSTKITIPVKQHASDYDIKEKEKALQTDDIATLNLGVWDAEKKSRKLYTEEEVQAILREGQLTSESRIRTDQLKSVLDRLRKQKKELLKEIQSLPKESAKLSKISALHPESKRNVDRKTEFLESSDDSNKNGETEIKPTTHQATKINKKLVSTKFGTSALQSNSSQETIEEPLRKQMKISKSVKSKGVQVSRNSRKSKTIVKNKNVATVNSKSSSPQKFVKKRRSEKEIFSSSEQSSTEEKHTKKPSKEITRSSTVHQPCKKQKQVEIPVTDRRVSPEVPEISSISNNKDIITASKTERSKPTKTLVSCECNDESSPQKPDELCEIVIKIKDGKSSQVLIKEKGEKPKNLKPATDKPNSVRKPETMPTQTTKIQQQLRKAMNDDCCQKKDRTKSLSWHEKLTKNNSRVSNSSTSYLSPPHFPNKPETRSRALNVCSPRGKMPQQLYSKEIISSPPTKLPGEHLNMVDEIKRLLDMSRMSVEELGVSSVSTVTTPSQSVIDLDSNKASTNINNGATYSSTNGRRSSQQVSDEQSQNNMPNFSYMSISTESRTVIASEVDSTSEQYPDILTKYAKIADKCSQRISNLSAMIEKVREEKNKMLQTSSIITTNDNSTKYMDLPSPRKSANGDESIEKNKSSSSSGSGEGADLLHIDLSLAEKLKGLSAEEIEKYGDVTDLGNDDFDRRLRALREPVQVGKQTAEKQLLRESEKGDSVDFVPLLLDIPKMPLLTSDSSNSKHKKPPPAKSFLAARRITDCLAPHELSTIPEQDSQMKLESTLKEKSLETSEQRKQNLAEEIIATPKKITQLEGKKSIGQKNMKDKNKHSSHDSDDSTHIIVKSKPATNNKKRTSKLTKASNLSDNSLCSSNTSGDEKLEMFRIEAMLRSIGMDWAISTLRKTQEALALTSSSSSLDVKSPATIKELSEADIKEFLGQQIFQKISSSTLRSDASPGSLEESRDFSEIKDFSKKQTSTPINRSKELTKTDEKTSDLPSAIESEKGSKEFFSFADHSP